MVEGLVATIGHRMIHERALYLLYLAVDCGVDQQRRYIRPPTGVLRNSTRREGWKNCG